ncbi:MAG: type II toxin-antitoxin system RelE/ParE family toxin [Nitrososphaerales archaeon]|jgi:plasmid stabilization system protein ParE
MTRIVFLAPAEEEMLEAAEYYESQRRGLGRNFLAEVQRTVDRIAENPRLGQIVRQDIRRRLTRRFPFGILYRLDPEEIVIIAVMHLRRRPGYWSDRV